MLSQDLIDLPIEVFGGYNPALAPTVVPPGASPLAQDCDFPEGAVTTRGGLFNIFGPGNGIPNTATINIGTPSQFDGGSSSNYNIVNLVGAGSYTITVTDTSSNATGTGTATK